MLYMPITLKATWDYFWFNDYKGTKNYITSESILPLIKCLQMNRFKSSVPVACLITLNHESFSCLLHHKEAKHDKCIKVIVVLNWENVKYSKERLAFE